jgi:hypothetical protein
MAAALALSGHSLETRPALHALLLAVLLKPLSLLILGVPKSLAVSLTAEDLVRLVRCAVGAAAGIVIGMFALGHGELESGVFVLDTALFLGALLVYKLVLYTVHLTFRVQHSRRLLRRMVIASAALAPLPMLMEMVWVRGSLMPIGRIDPLLLLVALLVRPTVMLIMGVPVRREIKAVDIVTLQLHLAATTLVGSGLMLLGSAMVGHPLGRDSVIIDALVFHAGMMTFALRQAPFGRGNRNGAESNGRRERLVVAGTGIELGACVSALAALPETHYEIVGIVTPHDRDRASMVGGHPVLGELTDLPQIMTTLRVDQLVVVPNGIHRADLNIMRKTAAAQGCQYVAVPLLAGIVSRIASSGRPAASTEDATASASNGNGNGNRNGHGNGNGNGHGNGVSHSASNRAPAKARGNASPHA